MGDGGSRGNYESNRILCFAPFASKLMCYFCVSFMEEDETLKVNECSHKSSSALYDCTRAQRADEAETSPPYPQIISGLFWANLLKCFKKSVREKNNLSIS